MDRRTFITAGSGIAAAGCTIAWFDRYGVLAGCEPPQALRSPTLVLVDATLPESLAWAAGSARERADRIDVDIDADVGALWYAKLRRWAGPISGTLRPSDCFVLRTCAMAQGRGFRAGPAVMRPGRYTSEAQVVALGFTIDAAWAA